MDGGAIEVEMAAKAGTEIIFILGVADDSCIREAVEAGRSSALSIAADLIQTGDYPVRAVELEKLGVDIICIHVGLDQQVLGINPIDVINQVTGVLAPNTFVAAAGGLNSETAVEARNAGADIIIVGGTLYKSPNVTEIAQEIIQAVESGQIIKSFS